MMRVGVIIFSLGIYIYFHRNNHARVCEILQEIKTAAGCYIASVCKRIIKPAKWSDILFYKKISSLLKQLPVLFP